ncbi:MAG: sugar ABC transporter permease [Clostridiales bacterium]|nr:sugar ABC transporter permease [Clostridiales bacterium]
MQKETIPVIISTGSKKSIWLRISEQRQLIVLSFPFVILVLIFNYIPVWGWMLAFKNYNPGQGIWGSPWVGLDNFRELFADAEFYKSLKNTFAISFLKLIFNFFSTISLAVLLNEVKNILFKRTVQTISYLPHFVSWVVAANIVYMSLSPTDGIINQVLLNLNLIDKPVPFMGVKEYFWWIVALSNVWKEVGWGTIIYLSAMTGIDPDLYEAAAIDGANRFQRIIHVTIPGIAPTVRILLILSIGWILSAGFEQVYLLMNPAVVDTATTLEIYTYNYAMKYFRYSYGTAIGIFNSAVSFVLIMVANYISKKISEEGIF